MRRLSVVLLPLLLAACSSSPDDDVVVDSKEEPLVLVGPSSTEVATGEVVEIAVFVADPNARTVRFTVDGAELATCDPSQPDEDCRQGAIWRWSTTFDRPGTHVVGASTGEASVEATVDVAVALDDLPEQALPEEPDPGTIQDLEAAKQFFDPWRPFHSAFGGISWKVAKQQIHLAKGVPMGSVKTVAGCMNRYGGAIRKWADARKLSRASVVATAITESGCTNPAGSSDGLSSGPMQVTGSTCAALTGLGRSTCKSRMHSSPAFSFEVGTKYMASSYQVRQHHHDPPKIAAAYNAGSIRKSFANRWHMLTTGNHIDRWVNAYDAYRAWVLRNATKLDGDADPVPVDPTFEGEHVTRVADLPTTAREGQVTFVGEWTLRDGAFYHYEGGAWRSDDD